MISVKNVTKRFDKLCAIEDLSCTVPDGCVYGLVGSNGAGKSTLLRLISGVYSADEGSVTVDGQEVFENPAVKAKIAFVPDELYFLPQANLKKMADSYRRLYKSFDLNKFKDLVRLFELDTKRSINTFSKGMKRQAAVILALSLCPKVLLLDETFDGLDLIKRNLLKKVIYDEVLLNNASAVITSHSLRELEDTCDSLALLHKGGIVLESDVQNLKTSLFKLQVGFAREFDRSLFSDLQLESYSQSGSVASLIAKGDREEITKKLRAHSPILLDILPLSLEEVFLYEMEALGYSFGTDKNEEG